MNYPTLNDNNDGLPTYEESIATSMMYQNPNFYYPYAMPSINPSYPYSPYGIPTASSSQPYYLPMKPPPMGSDNLPFAPIPTSYYTPTAPQESNVRPNKTSEKNM